MITQLLGGIGLFLLGMMLLSDGLKAAAGDALKRILVRFTGKPAKGFFSGLIITSMVQSSSATTLATIGFVSAGLLTFSQAIAVVIGSSVGTTTTGWFVSLLGLKLSIGKIAMPLIGAGALMKLLLRGRAAAVGLSLAGFGLIFVGIEVLQTGMSGVAENIDPATLPKPNLAGRAVLVLAGILMTVIMQSSSAAIATTITAFYTGAINLEQSLSLVIGASIGTTVTAAMACIGASTAAKRTAVSHILFNSFAGVMGFVIEPMYAAWVQGGQGGAMGEATVLALFHTSFTLLAAVIVLPMIQTWAGWIMKLLPDHGPVLTRYLDSSVGQIPDIAWEAARRTLKACTAELVALVRISIGGSPPEEGKILQIDHALSSTGRFLAGIPREGSDEDRSSKAVALFHAMDHLEQLNDSIRRWPGTWNPSSKQPGAENFLQLLEAADRWLQDSLPDAGEIEAASHALAEARRTVRQVILEQTGSGKRTPEEAGDQLENLRWMDTAGYHIWRAIHYLRPARDSQAVEE